MRAVFRVTEKRENMHGTDTTGISITLVPVQKAQQNQAIFHGTPNGKLQLQILNQEAAKEVEVGKDYFVDLTPAR